MSFRFTDPKKVKALQEAGFKLAPGNPNKTHSDFFGADWNPPTVGDHWVVTDGPLKAGKNGRTWTNKSVRDALKKAGF